MRRTIKENLRNNRQKDFQEKALKHTWETNISAKNYKSKWTAELEENWANITASLSLAHLNTTLRQSPTTKILVCEINFQSPSRLVFNQAWRADLSQECKVWNVFHCLIHCTNFRNSYNQFQIINRFPLHIFLTSNRQRGTIELAQKPAVG